MPESRVGLHGQRGWHLVDQIGPMPGSEAHGLEQAILKQLRSRQVEAPPLHLENFDGYTESWVRSSFPVHSVRELVRLART